MMSKMSKNKNNIEKRFVEMRAVENESGKMIVEGYAAIFEKSTTLKNSWGDTIIETIKRGAFIGADMSDVPLVYNHDRSIVTARTRNNSLQLSVDEKGLKITAELVDTSAGRDMYENVRSGLIDGMSFAFQVAEYGDDWTKDTQNEYYYFRDIKSIKKVWDVSAVLDPAYDGTEISARSKEFIDNLNPKTKLEDRSKQQQLLLKLKLDSLNI